MIYTHHVPQQFSSLAPLFCNLQHRPPLRLPSHFSLISVAVRLSSRTAVLQPALAVLPDSPAPTSPTEESEGPVEMPPSSSSTLFDVDDNPTPLQAAASVLLSGAIAIFLFRSLRRRAKRVKEMRVRSTGLTKVEGLKEESLDSLFTGGINPVDAEGPPSPVQALLGGLVAGIIAVILYKFTTTIEAALNRQAISDNFSVRQLTITIRTIVNGLCYLATFVFGVNSIGLVLYSFQLAFNTIEGTNNSSSSIKGEIGRLDAIETPNNSIEESDSTNKEMSKSSDDT